jgi:hypothetical protein
LLLSLKRVLAPARPLLLPVWRRVRPFVERDARTSRGTPAGVVGVGPSPAGISAEHPIRVIRKSEFDAIAQGLRYYRDRWGYVSVACTEAAGLIERRDLRSALELGPHLRSIVVGADVMDRRTPTGLEAEGRILVHDATVAPWPVDDKQYDLFVALQVFEHLRDRQNVAFTEVRRVARNAIISLPIDWVMDDPNDCHHRISNERALEWFHPIAPTRSVVHHTGRRKRIVYVFEDLASPRDG